MNKREFLKLAGAASFASIVATSLVAEEKKEESDSGEWKSDPGNKHAPVASSVREGDLAVFTIDVTKHPQTTEHFIDHVNLYDENKKMLFTSTILPETGVSLVVFKVKLAAGTKVTAVSHCNKHGFYKTDLTA